MKTFKFKRFVALLVSAVAMFIANTSSNLCYLLFFEEIEVPKSIIKK